MAFVSLLSPECCDLEARFLVLVRGLLVFAAKQSFSKLFMFETIRLFSRRGKFDPWAMKIPWRRKWQRTVVFLPGQFHERSPWGRKIVGYDLATKQQQNRQNTT